MGLLSMNSRELNDWADQKSEAGMLKLVGRWAMVASIPMALAAIGWIGTTLWHINTTQAVLAGEVKGVIHRIDSLGESRYRSTDAERDFKLRDQFIAFLRDSVDRLDRRVEKLESR